MTQAAITYAGSDGTIAYSATTAGASQGAWGSASFANNGGGLVLNGGGPINRGGCTVQNAFVDVTANTLSNAAANVTSFISNSAGNVTVIVNNSGHTGIFSDVTHTDSVADGVHYAYKFNAVTSSGSISVPSVSAEIVAAGQCFLTLAMNGAPANLGNAIAFGSFGGKVASSSTENNFKVPALEAFTASNLQVIAATGGSNGPATFVMRVNGATVNETVAAMGNAVTEDTTHSDSIAAGALFNWGVPTAGTLISATQGVGCKYLGAVSGQAACFTAGTPVASAGSTENWPIGGGISKGTTENAMQLVIPAACTASGLTLRTTVNGIPAAEAMNFRVGGANGNQTVSTVASTAGVVSDATHTDSLTAGNLINTQSGSGFGSSLTVASIGVLLNTTSGNNYSVSVSESGSGADAPASQVATADALTESGGAADAPSSLVATADVVLEAGASADAPASTATLPSAVTEGGTGADVVTGGLLVVVAGADSGAAVDIVSDLVASADVIAEAGAGTDSAASLVISNDQVAEPGAAADSPSSTGILGAAIAESGAASDAETGVLNITASVAEAVAAAAAPASNATLPSAIAESGSAADAPSSAVPGTVAIAETGAAADAVSDTAGLGATVSEAASASDATQSLLAAVSAISEAGAATDSQGSAGVLPLAVSEAATASDTASSSGLLSAAIAEAGTALDAATARLAAILRRTVQFMRTLRRR